jgi:hypothetical protein
VLARRLRQCTELVPAGGAAAAAALLRSAAGAPAAAAPAASASADVPARWPGLEWLSTAAAGMASAAAAAAAAPPAPRFRHDCFLSYRRADFAVADAAEAQLCLAGLRVFQDRSGGTAISGQPFDTAIVAALASSAVFCPLITLGVMQSLCAVDGHKVDWCLLEFAAALELHARGALRALYPLAVGADCAAPDGRPARDRLFSNVEFKARRDAAERRVAWRASCRAGLRRAPRAAAQAARAELPALVPVATLTRADELLRACTVRAPPARAAVRVRGLDRRVPPPQGAGLRPALMRASVRDVLLRGSFECDGACSPDGAGGAAYDGVPGILSMGACFLEGPQEDAALYLRGRYAASVLAAARGAASAPLLPLPPPPLPPPPLPPQPHTAHAAHAL